MFNIKNVEYQRSEQIANIFSDNMFTIIDDESCKKIYNPKCIRSIGEYAPIDKGRGCVILGAIVPSKVKRFRDYDFHAKIVITANNPCDFAYIQDNANEYPGHQLFFFVEKKNKDIHNIKKEDIVGGVLVKGKITDFMSDPKKKENVFFRVKLRGVFDIPKNFFISSYITNASEYGYTSQEEIDDIISKIT